MTSTTRTTAKTVTVKRNAKPAAPAVVAPTSTAMTVATMHTAGSYVGKAGAYIKHAAVSACINAGVAGTSFAAGTKAGYLAKDAELAERRAAARAAIAAGQA